MSCFKNVLEEIVVMEVQDRLKQLSETTREGINASKVAAFSLNRLPVLYASTSRDAYNSLFAPRMSYNIKFRYCSTRAVGGDARSFTKTH